MTQNISEQRITGSAAGGTLTTFWPAPIPLGLAVDQTALAHGDTHVQSVSLMTMEFTITDTATPPGGVSSFGYLQSARIYIESTRPNSTLVKDLIATVGMAPGNVVSLGLATYPSENLLPYIQEGAHFTSEATGTLPPHDTTFIGALTVHVTTL